LIPYEYSHEISLDRDLEELDEQNNGVFSILKKSNQTNPTPTNPSQTRRPKSNPRTHQQGGHQKEKGAEIYKQESNSTLLLSQKPREKNNNQGEE